MNLKICVSYRKDLPCEVLKNDIYIPFCCGASLTPEMWSSKLERDDTGDNISSASQEYCELSVQYWAWKNMKADYFGLAHYRRFLSLAPESTRCLNSWQTIEEQTFNEISKSVHRLNDASEIQNLLNKYEVIVPIETELKNVGFASVEDQYKKGAWYLHGEDLDLTKEIIEKYYPSYSKAMKEYLSGSKAIFCNLFILKDKFFQDYSTFLFGVLTQFCKEKNFSSYSIEESRVLGHLGERLLGIYIKKIEKEGVPIKRLPMVIFRNMPKPSEVALAPKRKKSLLPIVFSSSQEFLPFLSTALNSLVANSNPSIFYDVYVLGNQLEHNLQAKVKSIINSHENFSLSFINVQEMTKSFELNERGEVKKESYYRLLIPELFKNFEKVLYLDCDLIVNDDLSELLQIDLEGNLLAASLDVNEISSLRDNYGGAKEYCRNVLRLEHPELYFNAGVLLFNINAFRQHYSTEYLLEFAEACQFRYQDQDLLNVLCENKVKFLDQRWNYSADPKDKYVSRMVVKAPAALAREYLNIKRDFKILHFIGPNKPWHNPSLHHADLFWEFSRKSPFYEEMIANLGCRNVAAQCESATSCNAGAEVTRKKLVLKIILTFILCRITFGKAKNFFGRRKEYYFNSLKKIL